MKEKLLPITIILTFVFLLFSRFYKITEIPTAFVHDELIYIMQAKAISFTGHDMTGSWSPTSLQPFNGSFAELPSSLMALGINASSNPIFNGHLIHLVTGILLPLVLAWLIYGIWGNKRVSAITVVIATLNPWLWQFTRMTFDSLFSLFFYLLGAALMLNMKSWWKLLAIPALFLGFFQYQGMKLIFLPWIALILGFVLLKDNFLSKKKFEWVKIKSQALPSIVVLLSATLLFCYYIFVSLPQQGAFTRISQIVFFEKEYTAQLVNKDRQLSLESPLLSLASNKYGVMFATIVKNTFNVIHPGFLFFAADEAANRFAATKYGYFYLIDFFLLIVGLYFLISDEKNSRKHIYYLVIVAAASLPAVITTSQSFTFRASLFYMLLIPIIALAIEKLLSLKNKYFSLAVVSLYGLSALFFFYHYFYQYPVYAADGQFFVERVIANYIKRLPKDQSVVIYVPDQEYIFNSYLFYNDLYTKENEQRIRDSINSRKFELENLQVLSSCIDLNNLDPNKVIITTYDPDVCESEKVATPTLSASPSAKQLPISLPAIKDSGELYRIYNDSMCSKYELGGYIAPRSASKFSVENLSEEQFCLTWFSVMNRQNL